MLNTINCPSLLDQFPPFFHVCFGPALFRFASLCFASIRCTELRRYFKAAEEAANEVMAEMGEQQDATMAGLTGAGDAAGGIHDMANSGDKSLHSPSRMIALQLANSNPLFRCAINKTAQPKRAIVSMIIIAMTTTTTTAV